MLNLLSLLSFLFCFLFKCMVPVKNHSIEDKEEESVLKKKASIGGAENINEVRSLVKEWVLSSQGYYYHYF